jgi:hypothetical protein
VVYSSQPAIHAVNDLERRRSLSHVLIAAAAQLLDLEKENVIAYQDSTAKKRGVEAVKLQPPVTMLPDR